MEWIEWFLNKKSNLNLWNALIPFLLIFWAIISKLNSYLTVGMEFWAENNKLDKVPIIRHGDRPTNNRSSTVHQYKQRLDMDIVVATDFLNLFERILWITLCIWFWYQRLAGFRIGWGWSGGGKHAEIYSIWFVHMHQLQNVLQQILTFIPHLISMCVHRALCMCLLYVESFD